MTYKNQKGEQLAPDAPAENGLGKHSGSALGFTPEQMSAVVEAAVATLLEEFSDRDVGGRVLDELQARWIAGGIVERLLSDETAPPDQRTC